MRLLLKQDLVHRQQGQAMTEFVVSVSYVFLGLFVIIPIFGKLMDMQSATQQASRYVAWERTVWFDEGEEPDESVQSTDPWESVAVRSDEDVMNSLQNRFFHGSGRGTLKPISDLDTYTETGDASPVWTYVQSKQSMYKDTTLSFGNDSETGRDTSLDAQQTPSVAYDVVGLVDQTFDHIVTPMNQFLSFAGVDNDDFMTFAYETENYYSPVIRTQLNADNSKGGGSGVWDTDDSGNWGSGIEDAIFQNWDGSLEARSAILADGWNAQSLNQYQKRADDFVPSSVFDNDIFDAVIDAAGHLDGAIDTLEFGEVGIEPMPGTDGQPDPVQCDGGFCYY